MDDKHITGTITIVCLTFLQIVAWYLGVNDQGVFAFTTALIAAIAAYLIGFTMNISESIKAYTSSKQKDSELIKLKMDLLLNELNKQRENHR